MRRAWAPAALLLAVLASASAAAAPVRVMSVDQCADQYVLALAPRAEIVGVSKRALNADSNQRALAEGLAGAAADAGVRPGRRDRRSSSATGRPDARLGATR